VREEAAGNAVNLGRSELKRPQNYELLVDCSFEWVTLPILVRISASWSSTISTLNPAIIGCLLPDEDRDMLWFRQIKSREQLRYVLPSEGELLRVPTLTLRPCTGVHGRLYVDEVFLARMEGDYIKLGAVAASRSLPNGVFRRTK